MVNIMNYSIYIYAIVLFCTVFALSGINYTNLFKTKHIVEAKILIMILALAISFCASEFIIKFIESF